MIVWRNSTKEITATDFERIAKQVAREQGLTYVHYDKQLNERHVLLLITCRRGVQLRTAVLCDYVFPE